MTPLVAVTQCLEENSGTADTANTPVWGAPQHHLGEYFWPEVEFNDTVLLGVTGDGLNQLSKVLGVILGSFLATDNAHFIIEAAHRCALVPISW